MLKDFLKEKGIKQSEMAEMIGISSSDLSLMSTGKKKFTDEIISKMANILEISNDEMSKVVSNEDDEVKPASSLENKTLSDCLVFKSMSKNKLYLEEFRLEEGQIFNLSQERFDKEVVFQKAVEFNLIKKV